MTNQWMGRSSATVKDETDRCRIEAANFRSESLKEKIWILYILMQPFLDIGTSLMLQFTDLPLTIGIGVRMAFLVLAGWWVLDFGFRNKQWKTLIPLGLLALYFLLNFVINFVFKVPYNFIAEVTFLAKAAYPIVIFLAFRNLVLEGRIRRPLLVQVWTINAVVVSLLIVLPHYLGLSFESYNATYEGSVGWFNAANETGVILTLLYIGTLIHYFGTKPGALLPLGAIAGVALSTYLMGTKVAIGSYAVMTVVAIALLLFKKKWSKIAVLSISLIAVFIAVDQSPAAQNSRIAEEQQKLKEEMYQDQEKYFTEDEIAEIEMFQQYREASHPILTKILSSRDLYVLMHYDYFQKADWPRKLFGLGYASEYGLDTKMIEMDYFDFVFSFGLILGVIGTAVLIMVVYRLVKKSFLELFRTNRDIGDILLIVGILLVFAVSFLAGHVWFAPAVSTYVAILLAVVYGDILKRRNGRKSA